MLFDLRGRGRRRTVQGVYLGLAILLGGGLVLFGVGAGNGNGGLLNAFSGNGSNNQNSVVSAQEKAALKQIKASPNAPAGWAALVQARWTSAGQGNNFNSTTGQFTTAGKKELSSATQAWQRYLTLTKTPDPNLGVLAARAYAAQGDYAGEASAWEIETGANPSQPKGFECLAASAYAAKQTRKGDLATAKATSLVPKAQRRLLKTQILQAKTNPQIAQQC
jgi:predicted Zn-dependent protease